MIAAQSAARSSAPKLCGPLPPSREAQYKARTLEFSCSAEIYFALLGKPFAPGPGDTVTVNGRCYTIQHAQTYDPAGDGPILTVAYAI